MKAQNERAFYREGAYLLSSSVASSVLANCGVRFDRGLPSIASAKSSDLGGARGIYYGRSRVILYDENYPETIVHESVHDLLSMVDGRCSQEIAASLAQSLYEEKTKSRRKKGLAYGNH